MDIVGRGFLQYSFHHFHTPPSPKVENQTNIRSVIPEKWNPSVENPVENVETPAAKPVRGGGFLWGNPGKDQKPGAVVTERKLSQSMERAERNAAERSIEDLTSSGAGPLCAAR